MTLLNVPSAWLSISLGDIAIVKSGMGFPKKYQGTIDEIYPVYKVGDVSRGVLNSKGQLSVAENSVSESNAIKLKGAIFPVGTTLFAKIGEAVRLNRRAIVVKKGLADNNVMGVKSILNDSDKFIHYFMKTVDLNEAARSTTVPSIRKGDIENLELFLPALAEQKQIATKLDEILAQVDTIKTRLDAIPFILKRFRQSILVSSVSGKLTEEWRDNNSNFRTKKSCLKNLGLITGGKTPSKSNAAFWTDGTIPWVSPKDMKVNNIVTSKNLITELAMSEAGMKFIPIDSVLMVTRSGILAHSFPIALTKVKVTINQDIKAFVPDVSKISAQFTVLVLKGLAPNILFECSKTGTTVPSVGTELLENFEFTLPSLSEQTEITHQVEQLFDYADQIELRVKDAQTRVNNLTQSILAKAFRGELTAEWREQNLDLISGENSAEALLEKIQIERESKHVKKAGKTTQNKNKIIK